MIKWIYYEKPHKLVASVESFTAADYISIGQMQKIQNVDLTQKKQDFIGKILLNTDTDILNFC